jgi:hypothetical protein
VALQPKVEDAAEDMKGERESWLFDAPVKVYSLILFFFLSELWFGLRALSETATVITPSLASRSKETTYSS